MSFLRSISLQVALIVAVVTRLPYCLTRLTRCLDPAQLDEPRKLQLISSACYLLKKELGKPQVRFAGVRPAFGAGKRRDYCDEFAWLMSKLPRSPVWL